jgi:hypothetical protein
MFIDAKNLYPRYSGDEINLRKIFVFPIIMKNSHIIINMTPIFI